MQFQRRFHTFAKQAPITLVSVIERKWAFSPKSIETLAQTVKRSTLIRSSIQSNIDQAFDKNIIITNLCAIVAFTHLRSKHLWLLPLWCFKKLILAQLNLMILLIMIKSLLCSFLAAFWNDKLSFAVYFRCSIIQYILILTHYPSKKTRQFLKGRILLKIIKQSRTK